MLDIDIKPYCGVLFIRLRGTLNKDNANELKDVDNLLKQVGIRNIVFNITALNSIDKEGKKALYESYKIGKGNNGSIILCVKDNEEVTEKISFLLDKIGIVEDELAALNKFNI